MPGGVTAGEPIVIAVDGPAASGKGTLARRLAAHYGLHHLDTGLLYRAVGLRALREGVDPVAAAKALTLADLAEPALREDSAAQAASKVAVIPAVREALGPPAPLRGGAPGRGAGRAGYRHGGLPGSAHQDLCRCHPRGPRPAPP